MKPRIKNWRNVVILATASGGYTGFIPFAPGTWGTLVGLGLVWLVADLGVGFHVFLSAALLAFGAWVSDQACHLLKEQDSGRVVIDEIVGMLITMIGIPVTGYWLVMGFIIFRILDITKVPPASFFDRHVKNGWGVMLDDVVSGIYGNVLLHLMLRAQI